MFDTLKLSLLSLIVLHNGIVHAQDQATVSQYDCTLQQQIPAIECQALKDLFIAMAGQDWLNKSNWGEALPGDWYGVRLSRGNGPKQVAALALENNNLRGSLPSSLGSLVALEVLQLSHNRIGGAVPSSFSALENIKALYLFNNQLEGGIPNIFAQWQKVRLISFSNNSNLGGELPSSLTTLASLQRLFLKGCQLEGHIPAGLADLPQLQLLDLSDNHLKGGIPLSFAQNPDRPAYVNFSNNQLLAAEDGTALTGSMLNTWRESGQQRVLGGQTRKDQNL